MGTNLFGAPMASPAWRVEPSEPGTRTLMVSNALIVAGGTNCIQVVLQSQGNEAGVGFSMSFEPEMLALTAVRRRVPGALVNTNQASQGRIGYALAFSSPDDFFPPGEVVMAEFCFRAAEGQQGSVAITFGDDPVLREIVDFEAQALEVDYQNGDVLILGPQYIGIDDIQMLEGGAIHLNLTAGPRVMELQVSSDLINWEPVATVTNSTGMIDYTDLVPADSGQRFYRAMMK
jgi:hypothetical protein